MKSTILAVICCLVAASLSAQQLPTNQQIKGTVIDSASNKAMDFVTVALLDAQTKTAVKSVLSKSDGSFEINAVAGKRYKIVLAFIGYNNKTLDIDTAASNIDLGKILFATASRQLNEVTVTAVKPVMKQEVDRISYDVQADPESKAYTALDMMRKVPLLTVDASDAIKLKGSGAYKILVNGKESALMAKNPSDVLKAMPATNILKIEVITTPPAKYDAEGLAGIINIITKANTDQGYNIGINARHNTRWGQGANLNGTVKQGKFGFSGYTGFGKQPRNATTFGNVQSRLDSSQNITSVLNQTGENAFTGNYVYGSGELSYEIDSLNLLSGSFELYGENWKNFNSGTSETTGNIIERYSQVNNNTNHYTGIDAALNYQLGFTKSKEQLLTLSYKFSYSPNNAYNENFFTNRVNYAQADFRQDSRQGTKEHTAQIDYVHPLKKINIEAGGKAILRNNFADFATETLDSGSGLYIPNPDQSNVFNYQQNVYGIYNSYQLKLDKWSAKAGLRLEHTTVDATFDAGQPKLDNSYSNLIPSVSIQRKLKSSSINAGFTQRIRRPGIYQLNPYIDRSNPSFINTGNPDLKPELNNSFELTYSNFSKGSVNIGLSYAFSNNAIQNVVRQIDTTVTLTTFENTGSNKTLGLNFNTNHDITKKLSVNLNGQISRIWLEGSYNGQMYRNSGYVGNAFAGIGYKFEKGYRIGMNTGYYSGDVNLQGNSRFFIYNSYVVSKEFLNKNANISLMANNPYSNFWKNTSNTTTRDFVQTGYYNRLYRHFSIRVSYKFGKLNSDIKKNQRGIKNDDTSGGGKSGGNG
ncbi:TonB-dependent receptor [Mucilaginibacter hurinus]|uniref:TonB-dependent receptor n=1 Tax=Mucilaginibacter hurinus TaxID=2201324 RepID=A0A367GNE6_9SPHI|nr:outer membrane beta-barrel family protein [Mucilaginibacter hurinus]RCH54989.1 TonB-dependent receptor [Mucilaginibacter hurinus]